MIRAIAPAPDEVWRPCPDFAGHYEVSNFGRVRSLKHGEPRLMKASAGGKDGYLRVFLRKDGAAKLADVHRLVCRAFHGEQPNTLHREVAHLDGDRTNARAANLKWVGKNQNHSHRKAHGTWPTGEAHPRARLTENEVRLIRASRGKERSADLAARFGVSPITVKEIWQRKRWKHVELQSPIAGWR